MKMANKSPNTRLGGEKQELHDLKRDVNSSLTEFKSSIGTKFDGIYKRLNNVEKKIQKYVRNIISKELTESITSVRDSIIDALEEENLELQKEVRNLENKLCEIEIAENKLEQYTRGNNIEIQYVSIICLTIFLGIKQLIFSAF